MPTLARGRAFAVEEPAKTRAVARRRAETFSTPGFKRFIIILFGYGTAGAGGCSN
jgi:hypothetical protein